MWMRWNYIHIHMGLSSPHAACHCLCFHPSIELFTLKLGLDHLFDALRLSLPSVYKAPRHFERPGLGRERPWCRSGSSSASLGLDRCFPALLGLQWVEGRALITGRPQREEVQDAIDAHGRRVIEMTVQSTCIPSLRTSSLTQYNLV